MFGTRLISTFFVKLRALKNVNLHVRYCSQHHIGTRCRMSKKARNMSENIYRQEKEIEKKNLPASYLKINQISFY